MNNDFKKIARKIKRKRLIVSAILILATLAVSVSVMNYKVSQGKDEPAIVLARNWEFGDETTITVTTSLGFKHIKYESRYGKNYSECIPFWKSYDKKPTSITAEQYEKISDYITNAIVGGNGPVTKYFEQFGIYEADVIDVARSGDKLDVYLMGNYYYFIEHDNYVYRIGMLTDGATEINSIYEEEQTRIPVRITADISNDGFKITDMKFYVMGDGGSAEIWNDFSKGAAMKALLQADDGKAKDSLYRAEIAAAAHFGSEIAFDKRMEFHVASETVKVYQLKDASDISENEDENDILVKTEKLEPRQ